MGVPAAPARVARRPPTPLDTMPTWHPREQETRSASTVRGGAVV